MQNNPFSNLLRPYFEFLSQEFEHLADEAIRNNVEPGDIAWDFLRDDNRKANFSRYMMPEIEAKVLAFWSQTNKAVLEEIARLPGLKARFGGDIGPQPSQKVFERLGVYYDSLIVADPILRSITVQGPMKRKEFYTLKYCIAQLLQRDAYLADVYPPIAVLFGEPSLLEASAYWATLRNQSTIDAVALANEIFAQEFDSEDDAVQFFRRVGTKEALAREVANVDMFRFDENAGQDPRQQIEALENDFRLDWDEEKLPDEWKGNHQIWQVLVGRMMQANELLQASTELDAHPVIQAPISFHWLVSKVKVNSSLIEKATGKSVIAQLPITNALLSKRLEWLAKVPLEGLIRLRSQGSLGELRNTIESNFSVLASARLDQLERITQQVDSNLQVAFNQHQERIQVLNHTLRRELSISAPTLLLSIGAAIQPLFGTLLPSWIPVAATVGGSVSLKDIISSVTTHIAERRELAKTPIGILWNARK